MSDIDGKPMNEEVTIKLIPHWRYNLPLLGRYFWWRFKRKWRKFLDEQGYEDTIFTVMEEEPQ